RDLRPHIREVRQLRLVELLENACLDLTFEKISRRHDHVVAGFAGQKFGLQRIVGVEGVVANLDSGLFAEVLDDARSDIVGPIVDVDDALPRLLTSSGSNRHASGCEQREPDQWTNGWSPRRAKKGGRTCARSQR